jgi:thiol-disulfide isomerase/thioredoxin
MAPTMAWGRLLAVAACLLLLMGVTACNDLEGTGDKGYVSGDGVLSTVPAGDREEAISYEGETLDGGQTSIEDFRGKPVVVTVWGAWCVDCRKEAPWVAGAAEELGDSAQFVGINLRDSGTAQAEAFERSFGFDFPSFYEPDGQALLAFPGVLGPRTIPATVILDSRGRVAASVIGRLPSQETLVEMTQDVVDEAGSGARDG